MQINAPAQVAADARTAEAWPGGHGQVLASARNAGGAGAAQEARGERHPVAAEALLWPCDEGQLEGGLRGLIRSQLGSTIAERRMHCMLSCSHR